MKGNSGQMRRIRVLLLPLAAILWMIPFLSVASGDRREETMSQLSAQYVRPINFGRLHAMFRSLPRRDRSLTDQYLAAARRYVLTIADGAYTSQGPEHWRNLAERAHGAAVLAALAQDWPDDLRGRCQRESISFVEEFLDGYRMDPFLGNKPLPGDDHAWQASWWVGEMGVAAWFLWDQLNPEVQEGVAEMVIHHADRIAARKPGARVSRDTEAETVAWNSTILTLAVNMMPGHPHNAQWGEAAKRYAYTIFGMSKDLCDDMPGDDGILIKDWVAGANIHDDCSLENHDRFHIDYVFACYRFIIQGAAMYRLAGNPVPAAFRHHTQDVYEKVLLQCMNGSKFAVYVSDNDWRRYHAWTESAAVHGFIALTEKSPLASALEEHALRNAASIWDSFPKDFAYENPYVCGKPWTPRIADIVLLHLLLPSLPDPIPADQAEQSLQGAHQKEAVNLLTQYSLNGSFRSYYWGPGPTVRQIEPTNGGWMMLPVVSNYDNIIDGHGIARVKPEVFSKKGVDWFWVLTLSDTETAEAFISLPNEIVVMMHAVPASLLAGAKTLSNGVTIERPHSALDIFFDGGHAAYRYGREQWVRSDGNADLMLKTDWVNFENEMGYVVKHLSGSVRAPTKALIKNHIAMKLPKPGSRDAFTLLHIDTPNQDLAFAIAALPNQTHLQTEAMASKTVGSASPGLMACLVPPYFIWANYSDEEKLPLLPEGIHQEKPLESPPMSIGILRMGDDDKIWRTVE